MASRSSLSFVLTATAALAAGWCMRGLGLRPVLAGEQANSPYAAGSSAFELSGVGRDSALTIYSAATHTLYVYPGVTQGNASVNCEYMLHLGGRPGEPIQRQNCQPGELLPQR